jgi:phthiocerol/phenolphthiocerol synthesis type-I polyketide synthase D
VHTKAPDGTWQLHATAGVSVSERATAELSEVDETEFAPIPSAEVYGQLATLGLSYGPAFSGMRNARASTRAGDHRLRAIAEVFLPETAARHPRLRLHPALIESCLQVFAAALFDPDATDVRMPVEYGTVTVHGEPSQGELVHVSAVEDVERGGWVGELHLVDKTGQVLLEIADVFVREAGHDEIAAPLTGKLLEAAWRPMPIASHGKPEGSILVLSDQPSPLARALRARQAGYDAEINAETVLFVLPRHGSLADAERAVLAIADVIRRLVDSRPPRLLLVTTGAFSVDPGEISEPAFAALRGLVRVLA